jgi:hypothetical protein
VCLRAHAGSSKRIQESLQALQLETSSIARALKDTTAARERQLVEHDVLKLQVCALGPRLSQALPAQNNFEALSGLR